MNKCNSPFHFLRVITHHVGYRKLLIINSGLIQLCRGYLRRLGEGERLITGLKKSFHNKSHNSADQNAF